MGQEEERNIKRSGYCVVKYIVLFWTNELNKGLLEYLMTTSYYIFSANREIKFDDFISMELYNASPNVLSEMRMYNVLGI